MSNTHNAGQETGKNNTGVQTANTSKSSIITKTHSLCGYAKYVSTQLFHTIIQRLKELVKTSRDTLTQEEKLQQSWCSRSRSCGHACRRRWLAKGSLLRPSTTQEDSSQLHQKPAAICSDVSNYPWTPGWNQVLAGSFSQRYIETHPSKFPFSKWPCPKAEVSVLGRRAHASDTDEPGSGKQHQPKSLLLKI